MVTFQSIYERAADRKGGRDALEALFLPLKSPEDLKSIPDDRWLAEMTKRIFQAGFSWQVIENKWPGFEDAVHQFDTGRCAMLSDEDIDSLLQNREIVRNGAKIATVPHNAAFLNELASEHGSAAAFFADWPTDDFAGLLTILKKRAKHLSGTAGQVFLRGMGKDGFMLGKDVIAALVSAGIIERHQHRRKP